MAAGNTNAPSSAPSVDESLVCPLCLEVFTSPKILPCFHTFCQACLQHLVGHQSADTFPCPTCREVIQVPSGGVSAFRTNFYIKAEDLDKARNSKFCSSHPQKEVEIYCVDCDALICVTCLVTKHKQHDAEDITEAKARLKTQIEQGKARIDGCVDTVAKQAKESKQQQQDLTDKKAAVKEAIHNRHATLQTAIDRNRDEALASLDTVTVTMETEVSSSSANLQDNLELLTKLQQQIQQAVDSDDISKLVTAAREIRCGRGSEEAVQKLTTKQMTTVCRPVLRFRATPDATLQRMRDYMGSAAKMEMEVSAPEVTVVEQFRCREDSDTDVCHVCPLKDDYVCVSYEPYMLRNDASSEMFNADGKCVQTTKYHFPARVTYARKKNGLAICLTPKAGGIYSFAKRRDSDLDGFYTLNDDLTGKAAVTICKIVSEKPLKTEDTSVFTLHCAAHRALDVDASEQLFVVLEEGKTPDWQRRVQLYRRPQPDAIATYSPPVAPFQPSDVCFYTLGSREVLLVADELNDAIHVVNVQDGRLSFARYLSPGCPLLVQPTALNTDMRGRLWVACRGGRILSCTPSA